MSNPSLRIKTKRIPRTGATAVEFAIVGPILIFLFLASFFLSGVMMLQNSLTSAARDGGRIASLTDVVTTQEVIDSVKQRLQVANVDPDVVQVNISPESLAGLAAGDEIKITVTCPIQQVKGLALSSWLPNFEMGATVVYRRE